MAAPARTLELGSPWLSQEQSRRIDTVWRLARQKYLGAISLIGAANYLFVIGRIEPLKVKAAA